MNNARLQLLARRYAPRKAIVTKTFASDGWTFALECGHTGTCVAHMNPGETSICQPCGEDFVRTSPHFTGEWQSLK
jgi:hypothetical protein